MKGSIVNCIVEAELCFQPCEICARVCIKRNSLQMNTGKECVVDWPNNAYTETP